MKELLARTEEKMNKTIAVLERDYKSIRAGRANAAVLDRITVDYYGAPTPIQQMAAVSVPEPRILMIQPWDASTLKDIERAILVSDIGINPQNDGRVIRLAFPPLTEERRKDIVKEVKKTAEENKVAIRNTRRDALEKLKGLEKNGEITEDDKANGEKKIQKLTDKFCKDIDD
ncbi:MAG: ribosome recycling factor, partial [Clostridia bacterium]|nr:ribosome recycling factor [Clostridia bacterium]